MIKQLSILTLILAALFTLAERRALRVLPAEAAAAVRLERAVQLHRRPLPVTQPLPDVGGRELTTVKSNAFEVAQRRMKFEDYAIARESGTNTAASIKDSRLKILEVQRVSQ